MLLDPTSGITCSARSRCAFVRDLPAVTLKQASPSPWYLPLGTCFHRCRTRVGAEVHASSTPDVGRVITMQLRGCADQDIIPSIIGLPQVGGFCDHLSELRGPIFIRRLAPLCLKKRCRDDGRLRDRKLSM